MIMEPTDIELQQISDLETIAKDVQNGNAGNIEMHGKLLGKLTELFCLVFRKGIVTTADCNIRHGVKGKNNGDTREAPRIKIGPVELSGFRQRDIERWLIIAGIIYLIMASHGWLPKAFTAENRAQIAEASK